MADYIETENSISNGVTSYDSTEPLPAYKKVHIPAGPIIKWYQQEMTYEEKFRFGVLTYYEYVAWMNELAEKNREENVEDTANKSTDEGKAQTDWKTGENSNEDKARDTFWQNDGESRSNISSDDYEKFLSESGVDVSNATNLDINDILEEINDFTAQRDEAASASLSSEDDADIQSVLNQVNKDIHGGNTILTEEEIAALFAAAGN